VLHCGHRVLNSRQDLKFQYDGRLLVVKASHRGHPQDLYHIIRVVFTLLIIADRLQMKRAQPLLMIKPPVQPTAPPLLNHCHRVHK